MKIILGILMYCIALSGFTQTGLKGGSEYEFAVKSGNVTVRCIAPLSVKSHWCSSPDVFPNSRDRFEYDGNQNVTSVKLMVHNKYGKTKVKNSKMHGNQSKKFLIWWPYITNLSLLTEGKNDIEYVLYNGEEEVDNGHFTVNMAVDGKKSCEHREIALYGSDCGNQEVICREYFRQSECY